MIVRDTMDLMRKLDVNLAIAIFVLAALAPLYFIIPSLGSDVFLSPDETAVAVSANNWSIPTPDASVGMSGLPASIPDFPWVHPRSFVTRGAGIVPVGFLGLPLLLGLICLIAGASVLPFLTPILALTVAYPLWKFTRRFGRLGQIVAVVTWLTYPTVILYANRGLFPNLPALCLTIWSLFLIWERRTNTRLIASGLFFGMALSIRPTEAFWMVPWLALVWFWPPGKVATSQDRRPARILWFAIPAMVPIIAAMGAAWTTYGSPFSVGYFLKDPISDAGYLPAGETGRLPAAIYQATSIWPFGIHPMHVWFNFKKYVVGYLGPWFAIVILTAALYIRDKASHKTLIAAAWTFVALLAFYGQAVYQDHVGLNVPSLGNSFLRYIMPLAPLSAISAAALIGKFGDFAASVNYKRLVAIGICALCLLGVWTALSRDDEGVLSSAAEVMKYKAIRTAAVESLDPRTIVLSERSDKIFFPAFRAASPLPDLQKIKQLVERSQSDVALFSETLDDTGLKKWGTGGLSLTPIFEIGRQTLYLIAAKPST